MNFVIFFIANKNNEFLQKTKFLYLKILTTE